MRSLASSVKLIAVALLKSPLLHFVLLGVAAFAVFQATREPAEVAPRDEIVVTAGQVEQLVEVFAKTWQRPPTREELDNLIERRVREEVFYREALIAQLDKEDAIVRRRMQQKLEFMLEDIAGQVTPTEQELQAFLAANADRFRKEPRFSFRHIYFSADKRDDAAGDARALLAKLKPKTDTSSLGDRLMMIAPEFRDAPQREVARAFGREFSELLAQAPLSVWSGPIRSGYGLHLVFLSSRADGRIARLDEVREAVVREWGVVKRAELNDALYRKLRKKYAVVVERE
ncbi:MAG: peptidyl-prolyl cis-trans isomerase [Planctomycetota bacterium]